MQQGYERGKRKREKVGRRGKGKVRSEEVKKRKREKAKKKERGELMLDACGD